ncbi:MAG: hypothetical protein AAB874_02750 [Patescibacteria group bacterium]
MTIQLKPNLKPTRTNIITILITFNVALVIIDILFMTFIVNESKTVALLKNQLTDVTKQQQIIASAQNISETYTEEIGAISNVFPNEETITGFIKIFEDELRAVSSEYTFRFNAANPLVEGDKLFLPLTVTLKSDLSQLTVFLQKIEQLPFLLHIVTINTRTSEGFSQTSEVTLVMKLYVQNPFSTK